jgi:iron complex outermembrane recepter protein
MRPIMVGLLVTAGALQATPAAACSAGGAAAGLAALAAAPGGPLREEPADSAAIEGVVVDALTGAPLPGTLVRIMGLGRRDVTHAAGDFHLLNLPEGTHTVLFERIGYRQEVRTVTLGRGEAVDLRVEMRPSALALPGIVVTGTAQASLGEESLRPVSVVSGQELARRMEATLAGTLQFEPGMAVTSIGPATARPVIRGLGGDRVLVLEDGARVGDLSSTSGDHAVAVDPLTAQRIEVVRGPSALLYGSNAIGGVINVIRDEVPSALPDRPTGLVAVQGQSYNAGGGAGGAVTVPAGKLALRGEASFRGAGDVRTPAGRLDNTWLQTWSVGAGASRIGGGGHAGAAYRYYDSRYGIPGGFVGSHPEGVDIEMRRHSLHGEAHLRRRLAWFSGLDLSGSYTNYYHKELEAADIIGTEFGLLTAAAQAVARHGAVGPLATGATGVRVAWRDFVAGGSTDTPPSREWSAALFVLEELALGPLRLQGGGRLDWHRIVPGRTETVLDIGDVRTREFASLSGSLGGLYRLTPAVAAGVSVARAYRVPDTGELFSQGPHLAAFSFEVGNPELRAEVGLGVDLFVRVTASQVTGEAAVFRNALDNYIYYRDTGQLSRTGLPIYQATGADALLEGAEATVSVEPTRSVVVSAVASWVRGTLTAEDRPLPMMPPLRGQITARYERPAFSGGATWRAAAAQERVAEAEFEVPTPGFSTVDLDAGYRWVALGRAHTITLRLDNAADVLIYDPLSRIRDRDTGARIPAHGRSASLVYRVVF